MYMKTFIMINVFSVIGCVIGYILNENKIVRLWNLIFGLFNLLCLMINGIYCMKEFIRRK